MSQPQKPMEWVLVWSRDGEEARVFSAEDHRRNYKDLEDPWPGENATLAREVLPVSADRDCIYLTKADHEKVLDGCDLGDSVSVRAYRYPHKSQLENLIRFDANPVQPKPVSADREHQKLKSWLKEWGAFKSEEELETYPWSLVDVMAVIQDHANHAPQEKAQGWWIDPETRKAALSPDDLVLGLTPGFEKTVRARIVYAGPSRPQEKAQGEIADLLKKIHSNRTQIIEQFAQAYIAETGLNPSEVEMVEQQLRPGEGLRWFFRKNSSPLPNSRPQSPSPAVVEKIRHASDQLELSRLAPSHRRTVNALKLLREVLALLEAEQGGG